MYVEVGVDSASRYMVGQVYAEGLPFAPFPLPKSSKDRHVERISGAQFCRLAVLYVLCSCYMAGPWRLLSRCAWVRYCTGPSSLNYLDTFASLPQSTPAGHCSCLNIILSAENGVPDFEALFISSCVLQCISTWGAPLGSRGII